MNVFNNVWTPFEAFQGVVNASFWDHTIVLILSKRSRINTKVRLKTSKFNIYSLFGLWIFFVENLVGLSNEKDERFHQYMIKIDRRYRSFGVIKLWEITTGFLYEEIQPIQVKALYKGQMKYKNRSIYVFSS